MSAELHAATVDRGTRLGVGLLAAYTTLAAALALTGWIADVRHLTDWGANDISIQPNAAVAAMAAGIALLVSASGRRRAGAVVASLAFAIAGLTLFEYLFDVDLGIDRLLLFDRTWGSTATLSPGRMGPPGSTSWMLLGAGIALLAGGPNARRIGVACGLVALAICSTSIAGYLFGAHALYTIPWLTAIALQTATMIAAVSLGLVASVPECQPMRGLVAADAGGVMIRRTLPFVIAVPLGLGFLRLRGEGMGWYDTATGTAMLTVLVIACLALVLWRGAIRVASHEEASRAEADRTARAIAASEGRQRALVSILTDVPWVTDTTGAFVEPQPAWSRYTGQAWEDLRGWGWADALHPDDRSAVQETWRRALASGSLYESRGRLWHAESRSYRWFVARATPHRDAAGRVVEWVGTCTDVHAQKSAELEASAAYEALRQAADELQSLFAIAPVGIAVARDPLCAEVELNDAFAAQLGVPPGANSSLTGPDAAQLPFRILDERDREIAGADLPLQQTARTGEVAVRRMIIERNDGARIVVDGQAVPLLAPDGSPRGAIGVFVERTAEVQAAEERTLLLAQAIEATAAAEQASLAKDHFLAMVSHELRSPLNAMLAWVEVLAERDIDPETIERAVRIIERNVRLQSRIIDDLIDVSRIQAGKLSLQRVRADLVAIANQVLESFRTVAAARGIELRLVREGADPIETMGDEARLGQILQNLVHNAIKFTPDGGRIVVRVGAEGDEARISVEDSGPGIDPAVVPHIFDRFVQAATSTRRHGGLGLGLAIVSELTSLHRGTVTVDGGGSGRGAVFTVRLPRAAGTGDATSLEWPRSSPAVATELLLVEDDRDTREALTLILERRGLRVHATGCVRDALAAYAAEAPGVIVTDIGMPGEDGFALVRAIRTRERDSARRTPVIAMTGFASARERDEGQRAGFDDYLVKPVNPSSLLARIAELLASHGG